MENRSRLVEYAKEFTSFDEFADNVGWEDWMNDYTEAEDGEPCTEAECKRIDNILEEIFSEAHV